MKTIYKYELGISGRTDMHEGAEVLCVQTQSHAPDGSLQVPYLWALVDSTRPVSPRYFTILGTGHPAPESLSRAKYIGTFQLDGGGLVFHVFDEAAR